MHDLLEAYLAEVSEALRPLPVARRNDELREMRQHLLNAVIVNKESGQSGDEAVRSAVDQFGSPQELGESMVLAWRRGKLLDRRSFWGAFTCTLTMMSVFSVGWRWYFGSIVKFVQVIPGHIPIWFPAMCLVCNSTFPLIAGGINGYLFPKRGIMGAFPASIVWCLLNAIELFYTSIQMSQYHIRIGSIVTYFGMNMLFYMAQLLLTVLAAWGGCRARRAAVA